MSKMDARTGLRAMALVAATSALVLAAPDPARAGQCPPDKILKEARTLEEAPDVGVDREILAAVDLTGWRNMGNFMLRTRRLVIAKDGVVPTHWHDDRPSIVYMLQGELIEHSAKCSVPIFHRQGEVSPEFGDHAHWWENKSGKEVVILSSDVVPFEMMKDPHM